ncbi:MAG: heat-inducible transcription repressor HrcA [Cellulosilyticum sp.]|nr:heat-inducible transcription repressor HrcA [Cellulosilyticum sp.]
MEMNERKIKILEAIIRDYIETGDPVGSRTISKKYDLGISSATIRNEMADLEELGLILQPHTSAGRIPSDKGYRMYVDGMMKRANINPEVEEVITNLIKEKINHVDTLVEETAKLVAMLTNCATIAMTPPISQVRIKHIQLVPVDDYSVACVVVTDTNSVKHYVIPTPKAIDFNMCMALTNILNETIKGSTLSQLSLNQLKFSIEDKMKEYGDIAGSVLQAIDHTLKQEDSPEIYIRGANNILDFNGMDDKDKTRTLLQLLEEKPYLRKILDQSKPNTVTIRIGEENVLTPMKDYSVVSTSYRIGEHAIGNIGIIGPTRMDYDQVVSVLEYVSYHITNMLKELGH